MIIKRVNRNVFDIFFGNSGWDDWSRVRIDKRVNRVFHVKGKSLPNDLFKKLNSLLLKSSSPGV